MLEGSEARFVILSLDMANLNAVVNGKECLSKALSWCLNTAMAFLFGAIGSALECEEKGDYSWFEKISTLEPSHYLCRSDDFTCKTLNSMDFETIVTQSQLTLRHKWTDQNTSTHCKDLVYDGSFM
jgi:hypothetical protein